MPRAPLRRRQPNRNGPNPRSPRFKKVPSSSPAKAELAKKLANKPIGPRPADSDDSDRLVVKGSGRRGRFVPRQEIYASGAVGTGDKPGNYPTRVQRRKSLTDATRDILANGQNVARKKGEVGSKKAGKAQHRREDKLQDKVPHVNGIVDKPAPAKKDVGLPPTLLSSAVKPPGSILKPGQPTPTRENSIIGTLKPRRRQPSILQNLDQDSSSFDIDDEEEFLPDAESTPFNQSKLQRPVSTPKPSSPLLSSSSRKRKFGASDTVESAKQDGVRKPPTSPLSELGTTPEPSLPTVPVFALRETGRKHRESIRDQNDIMALPESSSSAPSSPAKTKSPAPTTKAKKQAIKPGPSITTKELLEAAMPSKRQRTTRERRRNRDDFDIPADSDSEHPAEEDDSVFLPVRKGQKTRRKEPLAKPSNTRTKAKAKPNSGKATKSSQAAGKAAGKSNSSTSHISSATAPILTPSTSTSNRETKSPSQQRSTTNTSSNTDLAVEKGVQKPSGGSRPRRRISDKENQGEADSSGDSPEVQDEGGGAGHSGAEQAGKSLPVVKGKWADIDAWDMDFEEVEFVSGSSSPTRR
ncbi:hypothetical protein H2200_011843 [Cladophialophora chaetospira]|uniref:Uncharacterized protein n=1 Tax=Cladophialophora chaetospira TaxID=386627 RepID=A0AA38WYT4_9EURO|nr:hypothetical protein H2200_011843 [Cladophialophora chaetospira]